MKTITNLDSPIFDNVRRNQAISSFFTRQRKDFKNLTKRRLIESRPSGKLYKRSGGSSFRRSHRASARGQRPAIDTGTLLNSINDRRTGIFSGEVSADAPYSNILQDKLDRKIFRQSDVDEAQLKAVREGNAMVQGLF